MEKRFSVLLHVGKKRQLERDIAASTIEGLLNQLESRIGARFADAHFFNPFSNTYQPLTIADFEMLPTNLELEIELSGGAQLQQKSQREDPTRCALTFKEQVVEQLRLQFLPLLNTNKITREEMAAACSSVCYEFLSKRNVDEATAGSYVKELSLHEKDLLRQLARAYGEATFGVGNQTPRVRLTDRKDNAASQRSRTSTNRSQRSNASRPERSYLRNPSDEFYSRRLPSVTKSDDYNNMAMPRSSPPQNYSPNQQQQQQQQQQPPLPSNSIFLAVTYTVAGTFPSVPMGQSQIGEEGLRVSLTPPMLTASDQDVVVMGSAHTYTQISLCWWLAYGPQRIVLNLDKMYVSHFVTTYQISETSFILAFRSGSLVPGWEYYVHLTAMSPQGATAMAQTSFAVPAAPSSAPKAIGSARPVNEMVRRSGIQTTSRIGSATTGYFADEEAGSPTSRTQQQQPLQQQHYEGKGPTAPTEGLEFEEPTTFQDQIREFFVKQVEPLYYLSSHPSLSEDKFRALVKEVARKYWFVRPPEASLDDAMKKAIVRDIKQEITRSRVDNTQTQTTQRVLTYR